MFFIFVFTAAVIYFLVPGKLQWIVLLAAGYLYYFSWGTKTFGYIIFSTAVTWGFGQWIDMGYRKGWGQKVQKRLLAAGLLLNFGMLGYIKYANFGIENLNALLRTNIPFIKILFPLGISFYTFQSSGYLIDIYWKKIESEKNPFRYALFVSFFPQLMQGPISMYDKLAPQLYAPHRFDPERCAMAVRRILFGLFKKIVIADWTGVFVDTITSDLSRYQGLAGICLVLYYVQLYMDFSGAMDIVVGVGEIFGISLPENFNHPYLAPSLSNFWKRWHITLGEWMMRYVFYPLSLTGLAQFILRKGKKRFGRRVGRNLQVAFTTLVVFILVGVWHGADWISVMYGLYNGLVISGGMLLAPVFTKWKDFFRISGEEKWFVLFSILRTQLIFIVESVFGCAKSLKAAWEYLLLSVTRFQPGLLLQIPAGKGGTAYTPFVLGILFLGTVLVIVLGILQEKGSVSWEKTITWGYPGRLAAALLLLLSIGFLGCTVATGGFIYAQF